MNNQWPTNRSQKTISHIHTVRGEASGDIKPLNRTVKTTYLAHKNSKKQSIKSPPNTNQRYDVTKEQRSIYKISKTPFNTSKNYHNSDSEVINCIMLIPTGCTGRIIGRKRKKIRR